MRIRRFLHAILAVTALCLTWQIIATWNRTPPIPGVSPSPTQEEAVALISLPVRSPQTGQRLVKQITAKDLFSPERKPPEVVVQTAPTAPVAPPSHLKLVGVLLIPGREEAFLADSKQGNRVTRVQKGEQIELYRLTHLTASEATLSLGDDGGEVALPLVLLSSKKAKSLPRLIPKKAPAPKQAKQARQQAESQPAVEAGSDDPAQIRENIRQLQRRLRTIRRQATRERRAERENKTENKTENKAENKAEEAAEEPE